MKELNDKELLYVLGGKAFRDCSDALQYEAATHLRPANPTLEEQNAENEYWDRWNEEYAKCLASLGIYI